MGRLVAGMAVVGLLVATGCGDGGDGGASPEIKEFCDGFNEINEEFANINPVEDPAALEEAVKMLRDLEPPDEIAEEYATVIDGFEALSEIDITDQEAVAQIQDQLPDAEGAFDTVGQFVEDKC